MCMADSGAAGDGPPPGSRRGGIAAFALKNSARPTPPAMTRPITAQRPRLRYGERTLEVDGLGDGVAVGTGGEVLAGGNRDEQGVRLRVAGPGQEDWTVRCPPGDGRG